MGSNGIILVDYMRSENNKLQLTLYNTTGVPTTISRVYFSYMKQQCIEWLC